MANRLANNYLLIIRQIPVNIRIAIGLCLLIVVVYGQTWRYSFVNYDDDRFVYENEHIRHGLNIDSLRFAFTSDMDAGRIPITWISRITDISLFGLDAGKHHLVNVFFHLINVLFLFWLMQKWTGSLWEGAFVAALFAVHPLHVESVAWVTERKDVLLVFFFLLSLLAWLRYVARPTILRYGAVVLSFLLSLLSKPSAVTFPFVLLLLDYWPLYRMSAPGYGAGKDDPLPQSPVRLNKLLLEKLPLFAMSVVASVVTVLSQAKDGAVVPLKILSPASRLGNAIYAYVAYLVKTFWPTGLAVYYPHLGLEGLPLGKMLGAAFLLCVITILVLRSGKHWRWLPTGWFWYLGTLVPVIGLVQAGGKGMADRCTYIPLIGIYLIVARGFAEGIRRFRFPVWVTGGAAALILLALTATARVQAGHWESNSTLFRHAIEVTEGNYVAWNGLGTDHYRQGNYQEAVDAYRNALSYAPDYHPSWNNLGLAYTKLGQYGLAEQAFLQGLKYNREYPDLWVNLAILYGALQKYSEALGASQEALRFRPESAEVWSQMGNALGGLGRYIDAAEAFQEALRLDPGNLNAWNGMGMAFVMQGNRQGVLKVYGELSQRNQGIAEEFLRRATVSRD